MIMKVAFIPEWVDIGWDQCPPTKQMQQGTQWKPPTKRRNQRELDGQMALLVPHSPNTHFVKILTGAERVDSVLN
jgi:hypothetical protein